MNCHRQIFINASEFVLNLVAVSVGASNSLICRDLDMDIDKKIISGNPCSEIMIMNIKSG